MTEDQGRRERDAEIKRGIERDRQFRRRRRERGVEAGAAVARATDSGAWDRSHVDDRIDLASAAFGAMWPIVSAVRPARLVVALGPDPDERANAAFEEQSRTVLVPLDELRRGTWPDLVGALGHELRHAWQFDIIGEFLTDELADRLRPAWIADYQRYDFNDPVMYGASLLEDDAVEFQRAVVAGLTGRPLDEDQ